MPEKDLKEAVSWELRKESGMSAGEIVADYIPAVNGGKKDEGKISLMALPQGGGGGADHLFFKEADLS